MPQKLNTRKSITGFLRPSQDDRLICIQNSISLRIDVVFAMYTFLQQLIIYANEDGTHFLLVYLSMYENGVGKLSTQS